MYRFVDLRHTWRIINPKWDHQRSTQILTALPVLTENCLKLKKTISQHSVTEILPITTSKKSRNNQERLWNTSTTKQYQIMIIIQWYQILKIEGLKQVEFKGWHTHGTYETKLKSRWGKRPFEKNWEIVSFRHPKDRFGMYCDILGGNGQENFFLIATSKTKHGVLYHGACNTGIAPTCDWKLKIALVTLMLLSSRDL